MRLKRVLQGVTMNNESKMLKGMILTLTKHFNSY
jgi:hypothetical protein